MKKYILLGLGGVTVILLLMLLITATIPLSTPTFIADALGKKYSKPASSFDVVVATDTGEFARGKVQFTDEPGGGVWFAAKTDAGWQLAFDGNGIIPCPVADAYKFPALMVPQCIDTDNSNQLVQRRDSDGAQGSLPQGYSLHSYTIATTTDVSCVHDRDCKTPMSYAMRSSCPFTSLCLEGQCAVVCPRPESAQR